MHADSRQAHIGALIITFNPEPARLRAVAAAIAPQVETVLVVDNGSREDPGLNLTGLAAPLHLLSLGDNYGIAAAQNIGIDWLRRQGMSHVLMLDHDAVAAPGMVARLLEELHAREAQGERVGAVGPLIHDPRRGAPAPFFRVDDRRRIVRIETPDPGEHSARVTFLIAAGVLLPLAVLDDVGAMDEALFIDYVDLEWSMRAVARGYTLYGHYGTTLDHRIGDEPIRLLGRTMMNHPPLRHYYLVRNALALWRMPHPRWHWKVLDAVNLSAKCLIFSTLAPRRWAHLRMILRGIADGLRGRYGRYDQARRGWRVPEEVRRREAGPLPPQ